MLKIAICGINGQMGQVLSQTIAKADDAVLTAGVDLCPEARANNVPVYEHIGACIEPVDIVIDFSRPTALAENLAFAKDKGVGIVIATTGFSVEQKKEIERAAQYIPVFFSANMSLGVNIQMDLIRQIAGFFGKGTDVEIVERHHNIKVDSPSGTALVLADIVNRAYGGNMELKYGRGPADGRRTKSEIGIHSIRGGTYVGEHDVMFITDSEVLTVSHIAQSKGVFADGALRAARFLKNCAPGLYSMPDIISEPRTVTSLSMQNQQAIITLHGLERNTSLVAAVFDAIAEAGINIDIITQSAPAPGHLDLSFSLSSRDLAKAMEVLHAFEPALDIVPQDGLAKISIEGLGMERMHGVAARLFSVLAAISIDILIITTSETKILLCVDERCADDAVRAIATQFQL